MVRSEIRRQVLLGPELRAPKRGQLRAWRCGDRHSSRGPESCFDGLRLLYVSCGGISTLEVSSAVKPSMPDFSILRSTSRSRWQGNLSRTSSQIVKAPTSTTWNKKLGVKIRVPCGGKWWLLSRPPISSLTLPMEKKKVDPRAKGKKRLETRFC